ncbi:MAG: ATP-dependent RecD-like DNA helicase [Ruminococcaceae bacterium]|nr:ATP-dependent RecD-like DNA helicase [Oscillospiraceae bacterium]
MAEGQERIRGTIASIVFANSENGYTVLRLKNDDDDELITAVGCIPGAAEGERLELEGEWVTHPSYGPQLKVTAVSHLLPKSSAEILAYLASGGIRGVGKVTAKNIVEMFGEDTFDILEFHPERLAEVKGISPKKAAEIGRSFKSRTGLRTLSEFLSGYGLNPRYAVLAYNCFGENAMDALRDDPYVLVDSYFGARFAEVDKLAVGLGLAANSPQRIRGAILYTLRLGLDRGSVCLPVDALIQTAAKGMGIDPAEIEQGLYLLEDTCDVVREELNDGTVIYLYDYFDAEQYIIDRVANMVSRPPVVDEGLDRLIAAIERNRGIEYAGQQRKAVALAGAVDILAITGGPGTGKTTAIRGILDLFQMMGLKTVLAAPTGRAAKRMSEVTGEEASTIHRLLGAGYPEEGDGTVFEKCESDPLDCDAVILDESSMVDTMLMKALLAAMPYGCRLVMVGDADQLPSVGPGTVFSDIIASGAVVVVRLTEIFRQARDSRIVKNAHSINCGELPELRNDGGDCFFMRRAASEAAAETIVELCSKRLMTMGLEAEQIQVLTPTRKGICGTVELNKRLQAALNPPSEDKTEKAYGNFIFREGDRVMQIRNNYDIMWQSGTKAGFGVFNGDVGRILEIDLRGQTVTVDFEDKVAVYEFGQLSELEPAYAMTVHKSQGSEYKCVVFAATKSPPMLLTRSVLYTALTRARELLIMVGDAEIIRTMTMNERREKRHSGLRERLQELAK